LGDRKSVDRKDQVARGRESKKIGVKKTPKNFKGHASRRRILQLCNLKNPRGKLGKLKGGGGTTNLVETSPGVVNLRWFP